MATDAVVVGVGPGGTRAAAALAAAGRTVVLVVAGGLPASDLPTGRGLGTSSDATLLGGFRPVEGARSVFVGGRVLPLPLSRSAVARLFPAMGIPSAASRWMRQRGQTELHKLIGGGQEQRSYRDWVAQRFGEPVYERLFAGYCRRRFGDPEVVSCNVARKFHGTPETAGLFAPVRPQPELRGVEVRTASVRALRTGEVVTDAGVVGGEVYVDVPPAQVVGWLDESVAEPLRADAAHLDARDAVEVHLRGGEGLPLETHVIDELPFYRVISEEGRVRVHFSVDRGAPDEDWVAQAVDGLAGFGVRAEPGGARVQRLTAFNPTWSGTHASRMRRYVNALDAVEITPVGRAGLHGYLDDAAELAWMAACVGEERLGIRERMRMFVEPPVLDTTDRARLTRFVER